MTQFSVAQATIESSTPSNEKALLGLKQVNQTKLGLLLPRIVLQRTISFSFMAEHTQDMIQYNTTNIGDVILSDYSLSG